MAVTTPRRDISVVGGSPEDWTFGKLTEDTDMWDRWDKSWFWKPRRSVTFEKIEHRALNFG